MSILDSTPAPDPAQSVANNLKLSTKQTFFMMKNAFNAGSSNFWNNPRATPTQIASALGSDAKEVFELHYALGQLIASVKPEAISNGLSLIGQFTMNDDGTVTISTPTTTTQEPITTTSSPIE
jgi:hypothetical protein